MVQEELRQARPGHDKVFRTEQGAEVFGERPVLQAGRTMNGTHAWKNRTTIIRVGFGGKRMISGRRVVGSVEGGGGGAWPR